MQTAGLDRNEHLRSEEQLQASPRRGQQRHVQTGPLLLQAGGSQKRRMGLGKSCLWPQHLSLDLLAPFFLKLLSSMKASRPGHHLSSLLSASLLSHSCSELASVAHAPLLHLVSTWLLSGLRRCQEAQLHVNLILSHRRECSPQDYRNPAYHCPGCPQSSREARLGR